MPVSVISHSVSLGAAAANGLASAEGRASAVADGASTTGSSSVGGADFKCYQYFQVLCLTCQPKNAWDWLAERTFRTAARSRPADPNQTLIRTRQSLAAARISLHACVHQTVAENAAIMTRSGAFILSSCAWLTGAFFYVPNAHAADQPTDTNTLWFIERYTKYEHMIPMRDGARLFARVYAPKDQSQAWPIMLTRTPYSLKPYGTDNYTDPSGSFNTLAHDLFILVTQDVRGRYGSEGKYEHVRPYNPHKGPKDTDESTDAYDTIDWLVKNVPNNNGKVGMFGISYPGFYTSMGMIDSHPALKAASPQAPIADWFIGDDIHHNGAFFLSQNFGFFYFFAQKLEDPLHKQDKPFNFKTPDGYDFFLRMGPLANSDKLLLKGRAPEWNEFLSHPTYDAYWQARNIRPHLKNIHCAVMTVGGWYDAEDLFGPLEIYRATERMNPGITNILVMGPWSHGGWGRGDGDKLGDINFHAKTSEYYREKIELPFFRRFLKDDKSYTPAEAHVFETGTHQWRRFDSWPPKQAQARTIYFQPSGGLGFNAPSDS